jgi:hypothetical protein
MRSRKKTRMSAGLCCKNTGHDDGDDRSAPHENGGERGYETGHTDSDEVREEDGDGDGLVLQERQP